MDSDSVALTNANRFVMLKNHLLPSRRRSNVVAVADDLCGLHATSSITPYLSSFNRIDGFSPEHLNRELFLKNLQRVRAMRAHYSWSKSWYWTVERRLSSPELDRPYWELQDRRLLVSVVVACG